MPPYFVWLYLLIYLVTTGKILLSASPFPFFIINIIFIYYYINSSSSSSSLIICRKPA